MIHIKNLPSKIKYMKVSNQKAFRNDVAKSLILCQKETDNMLSSLEKKHMQMPLSKILHFAKALIRQSAKISALEKIVYKSH